MPAPALSRDPTYVVRHMLSDGRCPFEGIIFEAVPQILAGVTPGRGDGSAVLGPPAVGGRSMKEESPARWAAGAAAPAPALRRRENLRSASFRDYAMGRWHGWPGLRPRSVVARCPCQRLNTALPSPRPGVTPCILPLASQDGFKLGRGRPLTGGSATSETAVQRGSPRPENRVTARTVAGAGA